ncbi:MAG: hypothetical protein AB7I19_07950 [Planctomycetota bacterium]
MKSTEFYVGYAPLPKGWRAFVRATIFAIGLALAFLTAALARVQEPGGDAAASNAVIEFTGLLVRAPYPVLFAPDPNSPERERAWLLVATTKSGVAERVALALGDQAAARVRLRGVALRRAEARVLELVDEVDGLQVLEPATAPELAVEAGESLEYRGEIIDPKCWLGAMRPGSGLVHRACAELCIRGGVPPAFVGAPGDEPVDYYLLADADGRSANERFAESAGVLGTLRARRARLRSITILLADSASWSVVSKETAVK